MVAGAGLAGCMAALLLARRFHKVDPTRPIILIESRGDFREEDKQLAKEREDAIKSGDDKFRSATKRSINLALSHRGISALKAAGLADAVGGDLIIPMSGRLMHDLHGNITKQPYGTGDQAIYSISRTGLNKLLLDALDKMPNAKTYFNCKVTKVDKDGSITYTSGNQTQTLKPWFLIGADGAYSQVREALRRHQRMDFTLNHIKHGYKELTIPPKDGDYAMNPWQGLHIWPRDEFMLIALPNPDKSFTCTLFAPFDGEEGLDTIQKDEDILAYFKKYFPDVIPVMPDLLNDFKTSPNSPLLYVKCDPYHNVSNNRVVIIGDSAHASVPFYGQGMNAAFEDCLILDELFEAFNNDPQLAIPAFSKARVAGGHALVDLSLKNYVEMRHHTASSYFLFKKKIEATLHWLFPSWWIPQYTMVAFTRIPYHVAVEKGNRQERILDRSIKLLGLGALGAATAAAWVYKAKLGFSSATASTASKKQ